MKINKILVFLTLAFLITVSSCKKDDAELILPTITFKTGTDYTSNQVTLAFGQKIKVGINAKYNGTDNLVSLKVTCNGQDVKTENINQTEFSVDYEITKSAADKETWTFTINDIAGNKVNISIEINGNFVQINTINSVVLGAQGNNTDNTFLSLTGGNATTYTMLQAFDHQADIDIFCFYEAPSNLTALAAPGSGITGIFDNTGGKAPESYTTKNYTYFQKTTMTPADFDAVTTGGQILARYDQSITTGNRKAKLLTQNDVYVFKLQSGKYGLFKVLSVTDGIAGKVEFAVKIQK